MLRKISCLGLSFLAVGTLISCNEKDDNETEGSISVERYKVNEEDFYAIEDVRNYGDFKLNASMSIDGELLEKLNVQKKGDWILYEEYDYNDGEEHYFYEYDTITGDYAYGYTIDDGEVKSRIVDLNDTDIRTMLRINLINYNVYDILSFNDDKGVYYVNDYYIEESNSYETFEIQFIDKKVMYIEGTTVKDDEEKSNSTETTNRTVRYTSYKYEYKNINFKVPQKILDEHSKVISNK